MQQTKEFSLTAHYCSQPTVRCSRWIRSNPKLADLRTARSRLYRDEDVFKRTSSNPEAATYFTHLLLPFNCTPSSNTFCSSSLSQVHEVLHHIPAYPLDRSDMLVRKVILPIVRRMFSNGRFESEALVAAAHSPEWKSVWVFRTVVKKQVIFAHLLRNN